ncbi:hypothetical protein LIER_13609 [Lithospermum erythrorhizon]|uniref:ATPase inhibitor n=1 Tax=Lithospermum erythrorhizon TaxID=34254 RepID=A0AAV3PYA3_LITER
MGMRGVVISLSSISRLMEGKLHQASSLTALRRFSDKGRILSEEERAKETVYIQKMERERLEKMRKKAEKEKAEQSDKKDEGEAHKS